jgi:hypothetical protein
MKEDGLKIYRMVRGATVNIYMPLGVTGNAAVERTIECSL